MAWVAAAGPRTPQTGEHPLEITLPKILPSRGHLRLQTWGLGEAGKKKNTTKSRKILHRCCQLHDTCYDSLLRHGCDAKKQCYRYSWHGGSPTCSKWGH